MKVTQNVWVLLPLFLLMFVGCKEAGESGQGRPTALGKLNEIVVVSDQILYDGPVGDTLRYYFESAYPILTSPEPIFDLRHFTMNDLIGEPLRKELRTYLVIANLADKSSPVTRMIQEDLGPERFEKALKDTSFTSSVGEEKWAKNQLLIYIWGNGLDRLSNAIVKHFPAAANRVQEHDKEQMKSNIFTLKKEEKGLINYIRTTYQLDMAIPGDYVQAIKSEKNNFFWIRKDRDGVVQNLVFRKFPYQSESQLSKESIIKMRDEYGAAFISSEADSSYMRCNTVDLPVFEYAYQLDDLYVKEVRGIWEMVNDWKGGPYVTYVFLLPNQKEIVFVDSFVMALGKEKRNYMQQLDYIVKTAKFTKTDG